MLQIKNLIISSATQSAIAIEFDENNNNSLVNSIPSYLRDDAANAEYELFIEMLLFFFFM